WVPVEVVAAALLEAGELDRAETVLTERLAEADPDEGWAPAAARFELGRLALARRDHGRAARELAACGAHLEAWRAPSPGAIQWRPYLAFAEAQRGRLAAAHELLEEDLGRCLAAGLERSRAVALRAAAMIRAHPADGEPAGTRRPVGRARPPALGRRARPPLRFAAPPRRRQRAARRARRAAAARAGRRSRRAEPARAAGRAARGGGTLEPRDRGRARRDREDGRVSPHKCVQEAGNPSPRRAARRRRGADRGRGRGRRRLNRKDEAPGVEPRSADRVTPGRAFRA